MAPRFSLQAVLQLRQHKEDAEERALAALGVQRQQVEATLERVRHQLLQWTTGRAQEKDCVSSGAQQQSSYARLNFLRDTEKQLEQQLAAVKDRCLKQQAAYLDARCARETLTALRQAHLDARNAAAEKQEQRRMEDLFLGRWSR